jgi:hypothetical protein
MNIVTFDKENSIKLCTVIEKNIPSCNSSSSSVKKSVHKSMSEEIVNLVKKNLNVKSSMVENEVNKMLNTLWKNHSHKYIVITQQKIEAYINGQLLIVNSINFVKKYIDFIHAENQYFLKVPFQNINIVKCDNIKSIPKQTGGGHKNNVEGTGNSDVEIGNMDHSLSLSDLSLTTSNVLTSSLCY